MWFHSITPSSPGRLEPVKLAQHILDGSKVQTRTVDSMAFVPNPLPPDIDWNLLKGAAFDELAGALSALGKLDGLQRTISNRPALLRSLWIREARLSSAVEDIHTTAEDMVLAGAGRRVEDSDSGQEAWKYVEALEYGVTSSLPLCVRLIREMHRVLLSGVRGENKEPGHFRTMPVYIGDPERGPEHARFVPCPPGLGGVLLNDAMSNLEIFANNIPSNIPSLVVQAIIHYQFETIHPFRDGNGRIGRVIASRSLVKDELIESPVVYLSGPIARTKSQYTNLLLRVSTHGDWEAWIRYFAAVISEAALDGVDRTKRLVAIEQHYRESLLQQDAPARVQRLVDRLFSIPVINAREAQGFLDVTDPTARKDLALLEKLGIIREITGKGWGQDWIAGEIVDIIDGDGQPRLADRSRVANE